MSACILASLPQKVTVTPQVGSRHCHKCSPSSGATKNSASLQRGPDCLSGSQATQNWSASTQSPIQGSDKPACAATIFNHNGARPAQLGCSAFSTLRRGRVHARPGAYPAPPNRSMIPPFVSVPRLAGTARSRPLPRGRHVPKAQLRRASYRTAVGWCPVRVDWIGTRAVISSQARRTAHRLSPWPADRRRSQTDTVACCRRTGRISDN